MSRPYFSGKKLTCSRFILASTFAVTVAARLFFSTPTGVLLLSQLGGLSVIPPPYGWGVLILDSFTIEPVLNTNANPVGVPPAYNPGDIATFQVKIKVLPGSSNQVGGANYVRVKFRTLKGTVDHMGCYSAAPGLDTSECIVNLGGLTEFNVQFQVRQDAQCGNYKYDSAELFLPSSVVYKKKKIYFSLNIPCGNETTALPAADMAVEKILYDTYCPPPFNCTYGEDYSFTNASVDSALDGVQARMYQPGETVKYRISPANFGPSAATNSHMKVTVPSVADFEPWGSSSNCSLTSNPSVVDCQFAGTLTELPTTYIALHIHENAPCNDQYFSVPFTMSSDVRDPDSSNDQSSAWLRVRCANYVPPIAGVDVMAKDAQQVQPIPQSLIPGQRVTYTFTMKNNGVSTAIGAGFYVVYPRQILQPVFPNPNTSGCLLTTHAWTTQDPPYLSGDVVLCGFSQGVLGNLTGNGEKSATIAFDVKQDAPCNAHGDFGLVAVTDSTDVNMGNNAKKFLSVDMPNCGSSTQVSSAFSSSSSSSSSQASLSASTPTIADIAALTLALENSPSTPPLIAGQTVRYRMTIKNTGQQSAASAGFYVLYPHPIVTPQLNPGDNCHITTHPYSSGPVLFCGPVTNLAPNDEITKLLTFKAASTVPCTFQGLIAIEGKTNTAEATLDNNVVSAPLATVCSAAVSTSSSTFSSSASSIPATATPSPSSSSSSHSSFSGWLQSTSSSTVFSPPFTSLGNAGNTTANGLPGEGQEEEVCYFSSCTWNEAAGAQEGEQEGQMEEGEDTMPDVALEGGPNMEDCNSSSCTGSEAAGAKEGENGTQDQVDSTLSDSASFAMTAPYSAEALVENPDPILSDPLAPGEPMLMTAAPDEAPQEIASEAQEYLQADGNESEENAQPNDTAEAAVSEPSNVASEFETETMEVTTASNALAQESESTGTSSSASSVSAPSGSVGETIVAFVQGAAVATIHLSSAVLGAIGNFMWNLFVQ